MINCRLFSGVFAIIAGFSSICLAQIDLSYVSQKSCVGLTSPVIVGDRILVGDDSRPQIVPVAIVEVKTDLEPVLFAVQGRIKSDLQRLADGKWLLVGSGDYVVFAVAGKVVAQLDVTIGKMPIPPPGPDPPAPTPTPDPIPDLLPIDGEGFRCLIVYESSDTIPEPQKQILYAYEIRHYLNTKCVSEKGTPEYRIIDKDTDMKNAHERWRKAMAQPKVSIPWIAVSNGSRGWAGPLPENVQKTLELLKRYGG